MAKLLIYLPSKNESWVEFKSDRDKSKTSRRKEWLDEVNVKVAGMGYGWKAVNAFFVLLPKSFLVWYTAKAGVYFLMETATVDGIVVNSIALGFLLSLDELITSALMSTQAKQLLVMCESKAISHQDEDEAEEVLNDEQILDRFYIQQRLSGGGWKNTLKLLFFHKFIKIYIVVITTAVLLWKYYHSHCEYSEGRWISRTMHGPKSGAFSIMNAFLPELFPIEETEEPFWTMHGES